MDANGRRGELDGLSQRELIDAPWWVRAGVQVGLPTVFAVGLMWFVLHQVVTTMDLIVANQHIILANEQQMIQLVTLHEQSTVRVEAIVLCLGTARTETERNNCFRH